VVTSRDIARRAGVSQATVSRVLNGNDRVSPDLRDRVLGALADVDYVPNASAKAMRTARSGTIGIVTSEILNPYVPGLLDALTREARARGLGVLLWNDDAPDAPMAMAGIASGAVDGIVFTAARTDTTAVATLAERGVPVLLANRAADDSPLDHVMSDHRGVGVHAADYLLRHGRHEVAAIFGPRTTYSSPAREAGFRARLDEAGVHVPDDRWIVGDITYEAGWDAVVRLLASGSLPSALFCAADVVAFGALGALREAGVRVPDDIWVLANDGLPMASWEPFDLTTHRQPIEEIARLGLDRLVDRMGGARDAPHRIRIPVEMIVRGSTAHAPDAGTPGQ
jgi:LacI family transcriptional regulator